MAVTGTAANNDGVVVYQPRGLPVIGCDQKVVATPFRVASMAVGIVVPSATAFRIATGTPEV